MSDIADDLQSVPWLHIYGPSYQHTPAIIRGSSEGLRALRDALSIAIEMDERKSEIVVTPSVFSRDGEGYQVEIQRINVIGLLGPLPYSSAQR